MLSPDTPERGANFREFMISGAKKSYMHLPIRHAIPYIAVYVNTYAAFYRHVFFINIIIKCHAEYNKVLFHSLSVECMMKLNQPRMIRSASLQT